MNAQQIVVRQAKAEHLFDGNEPQAANCIEN